MLCARKEQQKKGMTKVALQQQACCSLQTREWKPGATTCKASMHAAPLLHMQGPCLSRSGGSCPRQAATFPASSSRPSSSWTASSRRLSVAMSRSGCSRLARSSRAPALVLVRLSSLQHRQCSGS